MRFEKLGKNQRIIIDTLRRAGTYLTTREVFEAVQKKRKSVSYVSVANGLRALAERSYIIKVPTRDTTTPCKWAALPAA